MHDVSGLKRGDSNCAVGEEKNITPRNELALSSLPLTDDHRGHSEKSNVASSLFLSGVGGERSIVGRLHLFKHE